MRKKILLISVITFIVLIPNIVKAVSLDADVTKFNNQYNTMIKSTNVNKTMDCKFEDDDVSKINMENNGMYQSVTEKNASVTVSATAGEGRCRKTKSAQIQGKYTIIQNGVLDFTINRGPIQSGGKFEFGITYTNSIRWYFSEGVEENVECPAITISNTEPSTCSKCTSRDPDTRECLTRKTYDCCKGSETVYSEKCPQTSAGADNEALKLLEKKISNDLNKTDISNVKVTVPSESNSAKNPKTQTIGKWKCDSLKKIVSTSSGLTTIESSADYLHSKEEWVRKCYYKLPDAQLDLQSGNVVYDKNYTDTNKYKKEGNVYYIPLKWPTGLYTLNATLSGLSFVRDVKWTANYKCDIQVEQLMYDLEEGGFEFFYRPIILTNPFPNNREPSDNWITWWEKASNQEKLASTYNNLEYLINLSPNDMNKIKEYNKNKISNSGSNLGYLDYSINRNGTSNFDYVKNGRKTNDYSELGEFEGEGN